jgi:hypothetical protein
MPKVLSEKDIQTLVRKIGKQVEREQALREHNRKARFKDPSVVLSGEAPNQDELNAQLKAMAKREF